MKARIENSKIVLYNSLPKKLENSVHGTILGGYDMLSDEMHKSDGFYDVVEPEYDPVLQEINNIYFDEENQHFTYQVFDINYNLAIEKAKKIIRLKIIANEIFSKTDWYYMRELRRGISVPTIIQNQSEDIYLRVEEIENEINNLNNVRDVLLYEINFNV